MAFLFFGALSKPSFLLFRYLLFFLTQPTLIYSTSCFFPDGTPAINDIPCTDSPVDYCCNRNSLCFGNKVCLRNDGSFYRSTCTDQDWRSSACPTFCLANGEMVACQPLSAGVWCCGHNATTCCNDYGSRMVLGQPSFISSQYSTSTVSVSLTSVSTTSESPVSTSNSASAASASLGSPRTTTIPTSTPASSSGLSDSAKVGIGIGIPLGAIIIALLAFLIYRNSQLRAKPQGYGAEGKHHLQEGMTTGYPQQADIVELQPHQDPHELSSESRSH